MIGQLEGLCTQLPFSVNWCSLVPCLKISLGTLTLLPYTVVDIVAIRTHLELAV